jgi:hypothetical protein
MAAIVLATAARVEVVESLIQFTGVAAEQITPGMPVRLDTATGLISKAKATDAAEARVLGIAVGTHIVIAGLPITVIRKGVLDGWTVTQDWDAPLYLADTDGTIADAAGTVSTVIGRVVPGHSELLGGALAKLLFIDL